MITKADESNTTVAIDKNKYINDVQLMLSVKNIYETFKRVPTNTTHKNFNDLIKLWKNKNYINESMSNSLKSSNPLAARFYGFPKIHNPSNLLRSIDSFCGSPAYNLPSFYNNVISKNITPPISQVKNSFDFIEKVKNTKIPPRYKIISLDAVSLFTKFKLDSLWKVSRTGGAKFNHT